MKKKLNHSPGMIPVEKNDYFNLNYIKSRQIISYAECIVLNQNSLTTVK
jgi:hypothetical protein